MSGKIRELVKGSGLALGKARVFNNLGKGFFAVALAGLGPEGLGFNENENLNECKENIRIAAAVGARALQDSGVTGIKVEGFTDAESAAEGAALAVWRFQEYRDKVNRATASKVDLYDDPDTEWMEQKGMSAFLELTRGSCEPPLMLELSYCGGGEDDKPVVMVGKGTTYDSGGLCLKRPEDMSEFRADMAGAAVLVGTMKALAVLNVPINANALIPLYENMPGGRATKPGDIVKGLSGKTIRMQDTAREARVAVSDALTYTTNYKPCLVINVGTLTDGITVALGASSTGVYTTSNVVWNELSRAGADTGYSAFDLNNVGKGRGGDSCMGAAFLTNFVPPVDFLHMDISGTGMLSTGLGYPYIRQGTMTGRPTRTLVQFLYQMACPQDKGSPC
ncbi:hypothetical protein AAG570_013554 [Ranatra chinensis]|uniref:Cytosol aminopeptidase n=1 Tax=Ranatra chinensis TaxID=642074 RepID=A0ABD0YRB5_9HEMI